MLDRQFFFNRVRSSLFGGHLSQTQVDGMSAILDGWEARFPTGDLRWLAYMLATTFHETDRQMTPVREAYWLSEEWRRHNLSYYPYYGRGFVQLTHRPNYQHAGQVLGVNMVANPDLALNLDHAAVIMFSGMVEGWFRRDQNGIPHTLPRYFGNGVDNPVGARKIINGFEAGVAERIAGYHASFLSALRPEVERRFAASFEDEELSLPAEGLANIQPAGLGAPVSGERFHGASSPTPQDRDAHLSNITRDIVLGYISKNPVGRSELAELITDVYVAMANADSIVARRSLVEVPEGRSSPPNPVRTEKSNRRGRSARAAAGTGD